MEIITCKNVRFVGANNKVSLLDEIYPKKGVKMPIILFAHGFKGFKDWGHFSLIAREFAERGFYVIKFNFTHNGGTIENPIDFDDLESFSENSYWKELIDIEKILKWISKNDYMQERGADINNINIIGHSRGGAVSMIAASKYAEITRVISWAAISDFMSRLPSKKELLEWESCGIRTIHNSRTNQQMPMKYQFVRELIKHQDDLNIKNAIKELDIPQLIIHGSADSTVNFKAAHDLKEWNSNAQLEIINDAQHTFGGSHPWKKTYLPEHTLEAIRISSDFIFNS